VSSNVPRATRLEPPSPKEELHIIRKLGLPVDFFCGAITPADRGARLHAHLAAKGLGRVRVTRDGDETWEQAVSRWYGSAPISTDQPHTETVSP
jgi:hypothetical protein